MNKIKEVLIASMFFISLGCSLNAMSSGDEILNTQGMDIEQLQARAVELETENYELRSENVQLKRDLDECYQLLNDIQMLGE